MTDQMLDPPNLSDAYPLTNEQISQYQRDGHILLRGVLSPEEISVYREIIKSVAYKHFGAIRKMQDRPDDDFSRVFLQTFNLREVDARVAKFVLAKRFGKIVADLMGVNGVRIYYDKAMFKEPDSWITPWHQDGPHWPLYSDHVLTMWVPLVDISMDMGPLRFASGTHRQRAFGPRGIHKETQHYYKDYIEEHGCPVVEEAVNAGDVTFHNHWVLHGAGNNQTRTMRKVMGMTFYEDGLRIDDSACDETSRPIIDASLGNRRPGEMADSEKNQVVFRR